MQHQSENPALWHPGRSRIGNSVIRRRSTVSILFVTDRTARQMYFNWFHALQALCHVRSDFLKDLTAAKQPASPFLSFEHRTKKFGDSCVCSHIVPVPRSPEWKQSYIATKRKDKEWIAPWVEAVTARPGTRCHELKARALMRARR